MEPKGSLLIYIVENKAVASLRYSRRSNSVYVNLVHTLEEYRGKGYSIALFNHLFAAVKSPITLEVENGNTAAIKLYEKLGFRTTGTNEYGDFIMERITV